MKATKLQVQFSKFLIFTLLLNSFICLAVTPKQVQAQTKPIIINAEQPNLWTLEQAHYLLAQMHRRNLDLRAKGPGILDANDINGVRFDVLRKLLEIGASFDQAAGFNNNLIANDRTFNAERRRQLIARRDKLQDESLNLTRDIARLKRQLERAETQEEKNQINAEIDERTVVQAAVDKQIKLTDDELKNMSAATGDLKSVQGGGSFDASKFSGGTLDGTFKKATEETLKEFGASPQLNASLRLDNYLQMQYEIISKQLTLLRDEVGPGERLVFLEVPQTISSSFDKADQKWAQSWWKILGFTKAQPRIKIKEKKIDEKSKEKVDDKKSNYTDKYNKPNSETTRDLIIGAKNAYQDTPCVNESSLETYKDADDENKHLEDSAYKQCYQALDDKEEKISQSGSEKLKIDDRSVRTVELIPRQSSINVNDVKLKTSSGAINLVASFLFGFGAKINAQRQREQFSQFVQQELYSSGFGKGSREFGWTFTPMPGTNRLLSGTRTTYAVLVVPKEAKTLVVESTGCYFPRSTHQPSSFSDTTEERWTNPQVQSRNCNPHKAFIVPIHNNKSEVDSGNFYVTRLDYNPVKKGERIVVSIRGLNFSSQIGVLINGIPLRPALGLAQPFIRDDSSTGQEAALDFKDQKIQGTFERINDNQIILSFEMPRDYEGNPNITLIEPGKALDINRLNNLRINQLPETSLDMNGDADWMFGKQPEERLLKVEKVEIFRPDKSTTRLVALITGAGLDGNMACSEGPENSRKQLYKNAKRRVFVNGVEENNTEPISSKLIKVVFDAPTEEAVKITLAACNDVIDVPAVKNLSYQSGSGQAVAPAPNLAYLRIDEVEFMSYDKDVLVVELIGTGFHQKLKPSINEKGLSAAMGEIVVVSPRRAILKLINPEPAVTFQLVDEKTNTVAKTIITRNSVNKDN